MIDGIINNKPIKLFIVLAGFFIANALIAEFIGVKIFSLEQSLGLQPASISLFGIKDLAFNLTAGVLLWPVVFVMTDIINEYYGMRGVRLLSWLAAGLISYAFLMFYIGIHLTPADFWPQSHVPADIGEAEKQALLAKVGDYDFAYRLVFGQGLWIIFGSLVAFLIGQIIDVKVFHSVKRLTGERAIWLRATGSTLISQFIDSFVVLFIAFYLGADWALSLVLAIGVVNYIYKFTMAVALTPVIYLVHGLIERYLGKDKAAEMKAAALAAS